MATPATIWADASAELTVSLSHAPSPAVIDLLARTVWGSRGLLYRICELEKKIRRLTAPYVFTLEQRGELAVVCILNRKTLRMLDTDHDAFHFVMLATAERFRTQGLAELLSAQVRRFCEDTLQSPGVAYAYIEASTTYSLQISEGVGHRFESYVPLTIFSRLWPKDDVEVRQLPEGEAAAMTTALTDLYADHGFTDFQQSLRPDEYYVLYRDGRIVAGVQAERLHWSLQKLPGWSGAFIVNVVPYLPVLRRLLPANNLHFLRFGNVFMRAGLEAELTALLEAVLARHGVRIGLLLMDEASPVLQRILVFGRLGLLNAAFSGKSKVVADFKGVPADDIVRINARPMVVSPADVI